MQKYSGAKKHFLILQVVTCDEQNLQNLSLTDEYQNFMTHCNV